MADNVNVTPAEGGVPIWTDELAGGVHAQVAKVGFGGDGLGTMVSATDPLPVVAQSALPTVPRLSSGVINATASGDNVLLAGTAATTIRLFKFFLVATAAVSVKFRSGTTDLHPAFALGAGGAWILDFDGEPWFVTATAENLVLNLSLATPVVGRFYYVKS